MPSGDDGSAGVAVADLLKLSAASKRIAGLLDAASFAARASRELWELVGTDATSLGIRESENMLVTRGGWRVRTEGVRDGLRIAVGDGVGGRVLLCGRPFATADYDRETAISPRLVEAMRREGIHALVGVPVRFRGRIIGVLYSANRSPGEIGDRAKTLMIELAKHVGPGLGAALHSGRATRLGALEERQRISRDLHDNLSPLLFGIGTAVRRASETCAPGSEDLLADLRAIEARAAEAASSLREILRGLAPTTAEEGLPALIRMEVSGVARFTGLAADLAVIGEPYELTAEQESVLVAVAREGLHNVGRHARATSVLVTLHYGYDSVDLLVQDDGRGLPDDFSLAEVPREGRRCGLASLSSRLARVGGELALQGNEDGGLTLHGSIPTAAV